VADAEIASSFGVKLIGRIGCPSFFFFFKEANSKVELTLRVCPSQYCGNFLSCFRRSFLI
jgi:hypothetical protein